MKEKEFKVPKRKQPIFTPIKGILKLFFRKPKIINLAGELQEKAIILPNHSAKFGPLCLDMYFPLFNVKWAAHEMTEGYKARRKYLKEVFYMQKQGNGRFKASVKATFEALFSTFFYKGVKCIPSYADTRLMSTFKHSVKVLDSNSAIMIFSENSNSGYFDELTQFFPGFVMLSKFYFQKEGEDLPVYPCYYHLKKRIMVIGKPYYVNEMLKSGMNKFEIAEKLKNAVNELFFTYCAD